MPQMTVRARPLYTVPRWSETARDAAILIKHGADVNFKNTYGRTPLFKALMHGVHETVELLIKHGADIHVKNQFGDAPLSTAVFFENPEGVEMLLKLGAEVNVKNKRGETPYRSH